MKKYIVLGILFILPITAYVFFAMSTNYFKPLPILTPSVAELDGFKTLEGKPVQLENRITVLGFFGSDLEAHRAYAYNLAQKIYSKNHEFNEFQFVILLPEGTESQAESIEQKLKQIAPTDAWFFAFGSDENINLVFQSLNSNLTLDSNESTPYVFIIDKERSLRGRKADDKEGAMYGFDSSNIAEINNKMSDDVKVLLAEYRRALKKYKSNREI
ncbi:hypothetical protein Aeqsu_0870 [Aequorivita sublithincola DSM 14238]|uniref:Uncharacterized protein n=1 Tax=Aequorivita sublithincola (strain DSM 14238 / LMG 21431 / ACAM 643 / 9-3) TaxID=746697 RepID=I3YTQ5_AEQSU|nr:hypothetical protein [Aequorivita sublithincola]AFL80373.1 hypothetical protein Aeqsu_0870 [Aequorivita sublithincola DSM 14238]